MTTARSRAPVSRYALVAVLATSLLAACGYRPRGSVELPADFDAVRKAIQG